MNNIGFGISCFGEKINKIINCNSTVIPIQVSGKLLNTNVERGTRPELWLN